MWDTATRDPYTGVSATDLFRFTGVCALAACLHRWTWAEADLARSRSHGAAVCPLCRGPAQLERVDLLVSDVAS